MNKHILTLLAIVTVLIVVAVIANKLVKARSRDNDTGGFWFNNVLTTSCITIIAGLWYFIEISFSLNFSNKINTFISSLMPNGMAIETWQITMFLPLAAWVILLIFQLSNLKFYDSSWKTALVGTLSSQFKPSWLQQARRWILAPVLIPSFVMILLLPLITNTFNHTDYPVFLYTSFLIVLTGLLLISFSTPKPPKTQKLTQVQTNEVISSITCKQEREDWSTSLADHNLDIEKIHTTSIDNHVHKTVNMDVNNNSRIEHYLKANGDPDLLKHAQKLIESDRRKLIIAPDNCGQIESIVLVAEALMLKFATISLVIVPKSMITTVANRVKEQVNNENVFISTEEDLVPQKRILIWITDPETLSNKLMDSLTVNNSWLKNIGLVAWWDLHAYTGAIAGNITAIAHRLHRLIDVKGRKDAKTLAFIRKTTGCKSFVESLLPGGFDSASILDGIPSTQNKTTHVYQIKRFTPGSLLSGEQQHLFLQAIGASLAANWKTYTDNNASCLTNEETRNYYQQIKHDGLLVNNPVYADAAIISITVKNVLALPEIIAKAGRGVSYNEQYIGLVSCGNPYVEYILEYYKKQGEMPTKKALIPPVLTKILVKKHLLKGLNETPSRKSDIENDYKSAKNYIDETLKQLEQEGDGLRTKEIRYLEKNAVKIETEYANNIKPDSSDQALDTYGRELVTIKAIDKGIDIKSIDRERITIEAYPKKVFYHNGERYKVDSWENADSITTIPCRREENTIRTWRRKDVDLRIIKEISKSANTGNFSFKRVSLNYHEDLYGVVSKPCANTSISNNSLHSEDLDTGRNLRSPSIHTYALIMDLSRYSKTGIVTIAETLRYVLPVHLGIDEDDLLVIPQTNQIRGIVFVPLFSEGAGLISSTGNGGITPKMIYNLLPSVKEWLRACECEDGCEKCFTGLMKTSEFIGNTSKLEALKILESIEGVIV